MTSWRRSCLLQRWKRDGVPLLLEEEERAWGQAACVAEQPQLTCLAVSRQGKKLGYHLDDALLAPRDWSATRCWAMLGWMRARVERCVRPRRLAVWSEA